MAIIKGPLNNRQNDPFSNFDLLSLKSISYGLKFQEKTHYSTCPLKEKCSCEVPRSREMFFPGEQVPRLQIHRSG